MSLLADKQTLLQANDMPPYGGRGEFKHWITYSHPNFVDLDSKHRQALLIYMLASNE